MKIFSNTNAGLKSNNFSKIKLKELLFSIFFVVGILSSYSQNITRNAQALTESELKQSYIISNSVDPNINSPTQKVMACAGNAAYDNYASAQNLVVNAGFFAGTTCGTFQGGETSACNTAGDPTVWFQFTATNATQYVQIVHTGGGCYFGSAVYSSTALPTTACGDKPINCQSSSSGPLTHLYQLTNLTVGAVYHIQIIYPAGGPCGSNATFNIQVTTANPGGFITNPQYESTCAAPDPGCWFNSPPAVGTVTSSCASYPLAANGYSANAVFSVVQQFTSSASWSNFSWQAIITSNCAGGNVVWLNWTLYNCSCGILTCGDINTLTGNGLTCSTCYILLYQFELANCSSFVTVWPYQNVPAAPIPCTPPLPIELLYFIGKSNSGFGTILDWETISETHTKNFSITRSADGINFSEIATLPAAGNSSSSKKYSYTDNGANDHGTFYYKLNENKQDGSAGFSKLIAITLEGNKDLTHFVPNPASSNFDIVFGKDALNQETHLVIFNALGQIVKEEKFIPETVLKNINIEEFNKGIYFINISTPASSEIIKYKLVKE